MGLETLIDSFNYSEEYLDASLPYTTLIGDRQLEENFNYKIKKSSFFYNNNDEKTLILFSRYAPSFSDYAESMNTPFFAETTPNINMESGNAEMKNREFKTKEELFKEAYDAFDAPDIAELEAMEFINQCEELYKMKTNEFLKWFKERNYEGNVDMQLWAHHSEYLGLDGDVD